MELIENGCIELHESDPHAARDAVERLIQEGAKSVLLLAADGNPCVAKDFDPWLQKVPVPIFGGVFPQLIFSRTNQERGYLVLGLRDHCGVGVIGGLSSATADFTPGLEAVLGELPPPAAAMVLVDGLASQIGGFLEAVYDVLGGDISYFGGGAGSLSFEHKPCLFSNSGMLMDHALLILLPRPVTVGVEHGWEKFAGPFTVTDADRNVVKSLDYSPAFETYRKLVEADSGLSFDSQDFFSIAKGYPLGMEQSDGEIVVRDPITRDGDALVCVGEVAANTTVYVLKGHPGKLIDAAAACAKRLPYSGSPAFLVDCISRVLFLEKRFDEEIESVMRELGERPLVGVLSLGEIANGGNYCLEFYNKTVVLAATR